MSYDNDHQITCLLNLNLRSSKVTQRTPAASQPRKKVKKTKSKTEPQSSNRSEVESYRSDVADDITAGDNDEETNEETISTSGSDLSE